MDSRSRRLPFCLPSSRSSYTSSPAVSSSSSLGASRLYSRDTGLNNDSFPRASSAYKSDLDQQNSRLLRSSRDYSSSDSHCSSWKFPSSLTSSSRSYERPSWTESSLSSRSKQTDSEGRLGMRSVLLNATDDGDSKRAKLSYNNRGLYSRTPSTSVTGSTYSSNGLSSSRGAGEKHSDKYDSSWRSSLLSRREPEPKTEPSLSSLGERRNRTPGLTSSLYQTDRVTSTYAQGARPKETTYSPSSSSSSSSSSYSMTRDSSLNRHFSPSTSHRSSPAVHDYSSRTSGRVLNSSSSLRSSQEPTRTSNISSSYLPRSSWHSTPAPRTEVLLPPRPAPEGAEQEGRRSTCRLLSRLFSRRTSQDSSSGSSSVRSLDDESSTTGGESADSDEGARMAGVDPVSGGSEATVGGLRNRRIDLAPIQESNSAGYRSSMARSQTSSWREPGVSSGSVNSSSGGGSSSTSWLSSSLRGRCPPLLARLRRHARNDGAHSAAGLEEGYSRPERLLRRWDNLERKTSPDDDEDDDDDDDEDEEEEEEEEGEDEKEEDKEEGAVGLGAFGAGRLYAVEEETLPELENSSAVFSPLRRSRLYENFSASLSPSGGTESQLDSQREKPVPSRDQEKLRKIKERLLLEDSDEDEGDLCRICQMGEESQSNPLIQPCRCTGSLQYVHQECIKRWLRSKIGSGTNFEAITTCELCKQKLRLNIDNFDIQELYRTHVQSEYDEFISSGLYLVVLLHFCEQRFSDVLGAVDAAGLFNLVRILHEHMDNLEIPHNESDEEIRDNRPSIEFSDLDDDLEEEY